MLPACFSNPTSSVTPSSIPSSTSHPPHTSPSPPQPLSNNLVTCTYQSLLFNTPILLTLTWSRTHSCRTLTLHAPHFFSVTISLNPSPLSFFFTRLGSGSRGSKSIPLSQIHGDDDDDPHVNNPQHTHSRKKKIKNKTKVKLYWDFTRAEFTRSSAAEPESSFYLALTCNGRVEFFLGDLKSELARRVGSGSVRVESAAESAPTQSLLSRREHVFGRRSYSTRAQFLNSKKHEIEIECGGGAMKVKIDGEIRLVVKRLVWKFRGNERISVGGVDVDFFWDVFNWVNSNHHHNKNGGSGKRISGNGHGGHGVFVFQVGDGRVWPEMVGPEKKLLRKSLSSSPAAAAGGLAALSPAPSWTSSVLQWAEETSDCGRSSSSNSSSVTTNKSCWGGGVSGGGGGFSLVLYAWRRV